MGYFPSAVAKEIELLQPYNGLGAPEDHLLWQLNFLCNFDKHKVVPLAGHALASSLCPGKEKGTMHKPEIQIGNSGSKDSTGHVAE